MKLKWIIIGVVALGILLLVGSLTGANQKLFKMAVDQLWDDTTRVVEIQAENQKWYEETIKYMQDKLDLKGKELAATETRLAQANRNINEKDSEIIRLRKEREGIITSSDPGAIIDDLHKLGYRTERRRAR
jgi:hypothetical protein